MSNIDKISKKAARALFIEAQGLTRDFSSAQDVLNHLGYVQIDTISVVERAHHHIFWSRYPSYHVNDLDKMIADRKAFEYWAHAASYLPMHNYRFSLYRKKLFQNHLSNWWPKDVKVMGYVYDKIKAEGPLQSKDFKSIRNSRGGWWDWKPTKKALERLFMEGKLEITGRSGFQKIYDLAERVIPADVDTKAPSDREYARYLIKRTLGHHAIAGPKEMAYLRPGREKQIVLNEIKEMLSNKELRKISIDGIDDVYYALPNNLDHFTDIKENVHILSPFDNMIIQRDKLAKFFDFHYQIECYVPAAKRKYGYFTHPILVDGDLVARVDCKAHRKDEILTVQSLHWEHEQYQKKYTDRVIQKLIEFAAFNGCILEIE